MFDVTRQNGATARVRQVGGQKERKESDDGPFSVFFFLLKGALG